MPFNPPKPEARLVQYEHDRFKLDEGFRFTFDDSQDPEQKSPYTVSQHGIGAAGTDLASVPSLLWWYVGSYGRHTNAALLHDVLVRRKGFNRAKADTAFRHALAESGVPIVRRWLMYTAVSLETFSQRIGGRALLAILLTILAGSIAAAIWYAIDSPGWTSAAFVVAALCLWIALLRSRALWLPLGILLIGPPYAVVWWFKRTSGLLEVPAVLVRNGWAAFARHTISRKNPSKWPPGERLSGEYEATRVGDAYAQTIVSDDS
jgi:hypothetical protein